MQSSEGSRRAAKYKANRALFQMLLGAAGGSHPNRQSSGSERLSGRSRSAN